MRILVDTKFRYSIWITITGAFGRMIIILQQLIKKNKRMIIGKGSCLELQRGQVVIIKKKVQNI